MKKNPDRASKNGRPESSAEDTVGQKHLCLGRDCRYQEELRRLQIELVKVEEWVRHKGLRIVVLFEGHDAAGKGGTMKRITESLNPRICKVVALGTPTEREKTVIVGAAGIVIAAASNNVAKGLYAYCFSDRTTGLQSMTLLMALALAGLVPLVWLLR